MTQLYYDHFWEEREDLSPEMIAFCQGHEEGYQEGIEYLERTHADFERLEQENKALKNYIAANIRVMKAEIRKELEEEIANTNIS